MTQKETNNNVILFSVIFFILGGVVMSIIKDKRHQSPVVRESIPQVVVEKECLKTTESNDSEDIKKMMLVLSHLTNEVNNLSNAKKGDSPSQSLSEDSVLKILKLISDMSAKMDDMNRSLQSQVDVALKNSRNSLSHSAMADQKIDEIRRMILNQTYQKDIAELNRKLDELAKKPVIIQQPSLAQTPPNVAPNQPQNAPKPPPPTIKHQQPMVESKPIEDAKPVFNLNKGLSVRKDLPPDYEKPERKYKVDELK